MGFARTLDVDSVLTSDSKAVFVVRGSSELLLKKPTDAAGSGAHEVVTALDHTVVVLYRTQKNYSDESWEKACQQFKLFAGKHVYFHTVTPHMSWENADSTLVSTEEIHVEAVNADK